MKASELISIMTRIKEHFDDPEVIIKWGEVGYMLKNYLVKSVSYEIAGDFSITIGAEQGAKP